MLTKRVVLLRKAFHDLQDVRKHEAYSWDLLDRTTDAVKKAQKQFRRDKHFRRANTDEVVAVLDEIIQDLELIKHKLAEGT